MTQDNGGWWGCYFWCLLTASAPHTALSPWAISFGAFRWPELIRGNITFIFSASKIQKSFPESVHKQNAMEKMEVLVIVICLRGYRKDILIESLTPFRNDHIINYLLLTLAFFIFF